MVIVIPGEFAGLNEVINASRTHWAKGAKIKSEEMNWVRLSLMEQKARPVKSYPVRLFFHWHCRNKKKDPDNIASAAKTILDGLQQGGVLENDGWKQINGLSHEFSVDKDNPRVEIFIEEA